jgi:hypothetical protein
MRLFISNIFVLLIAFYDASAQQILSIKGVIRDTHTASPVVGATIILKEKKVSTITERRYSSNLSDRNCYWVCSKRITYYRTMAIRKHRHQPAAIRILYTRGHSDFTPAQ